MSHVKDFALWCDEVGVAPTPAMIERYQTDNGICRRCRQRGRELKGGICGNCGDDLRGERDAEEAGA